jgi:hypothetical protein
MKITLSIKNIVYIAVFTALGVFILSSRCSYRKEIDRLSTGLYEAQGAIKTKDVLIDSQRRRIFSADAQVVSSQDAVKRLESEKEYFKQLRISELKTLSALKLEVEILRKQGTYRDTVIVRDTIFSGGLDSSMNLRYINWSDSWAWAKVILYPNKPSVSLGLYESDMNIKVYYKGFIKPKPMVSVVSDNPYIGITSAHAIIVEDNKKIYMKRWPYLVAGVFTGWLIFK